MRYLSYDFFCFLLLTMLLYYLPAGCLRGERLRAGLQQGVLLLASLAFCLYAGGLPALILFCATVALGYGLGRGMTALHRRARGGFRARLLFAGALLLTLSPLLLVKGCSWFAGLRALLGKSLIVPVGLSFYSLQIAAYLTDCYTGRIEAERSFPRWALFVSFFPQLVQGPIPRWAQLGPQLRVWHKFSPERCVSGFQRILWGCFLKLMIADKAAAAVDPIFAAPAQYTGWYVVLAAVLYSLQLYADFSACVSICRGAAELFGIRLEENFRQPYLATSIQDFWRRWHISLSSWLRDYLYVPLGGSRKGALRRDLNLLLVFLVSGLWHGNGWTFVVWGLLHALFQLAGRHLKPLTDRLCVRLRIDRSRFGWVLLGRVRTFALAAAAWVVFRAASLGDALRLFQNLFADWNPWLLFGAERFSYGLSVHEWFLLLGSIGILIAVSECRERRVPLRRIFDRQWLPIRWLVYLAAICALWVFGSYGSGFNAADFIYGGF